MVRAALAGVPELAVDEREVHREGLSYTVDTLRSLRAELPDRALCLVVGSDAFRRFDRWHEWRSFPSLAHICVATRPGSGLPDAGELGEFVRTYRTADLACLRRGVAGKLLVCEIPPLDISATYVRALVREGRSIRFLVPEPVRAIMETHGIYRDDQ
jgi:nicotinate-nucleotide adenylyltransferase